MATSQNNTLSFHLTAAEKTRLDDAFGTIEEILVPKLIALTLEGRNELPKMGDVTLGFVTKALEYAKSHPTLVPTFTDVTELETDLLGAAVLSGYLRRLNILMSGLSDTAMLSGSEAYVAALSFYQNVKLAAKNNIPGAQAIYADLSERFPGRPKKHVAPATSNP